MAFLSAHSLVPNKTLIPSPHSVTPSRNHRFRPISTPPPLSRTRIISASSSSSSTTTTTTTTKAPPQSPTGWQEFAARVSGEWDGFGADFTPDGNPIELPENVVPEAFREWEVRVFDWQTQCPTLAESDRPLLTRKLIKLLPTVGCEADAATRYSVEERVAGGDGNMAAAFGYDTNGCYVAVWPVEGRGVGRLLELEHCLVDPGNREVRVRVVQVVKVDEGVMRLERIKAFSEQWYGPFRNGEQLGGCAIRESGFAVTAAVDESKVVGAWQGMSVAVASFEKRIDIFNELVADRPQKSSRDQLGLVALPKQLWCSIKEKDGETWGEVGWLVDHGCAMISRCVFRQDGSLKEIAVGKETAALEGM